jgi:hypothetical protein
MTKSAIAVTTLAVMFFWASPAQASDDKTDKNEVVLLPAIERSPALPALYVGLAALNVYDGVTTLRGVKNGAREANVMMAPIANSAPAMWVVKGAVTATTILAAERMWKAGHRRRAIALAAISNGLMVAVAARNASVLRAQR